MSDNSNFEIIEMKCADCGGIYKVADNNTFKCPFCGSTKVIIDSDAVRIAKMRYDTYKEIELERIRKEHERLTPKELTHKQKVFLLTSMSLLIIFLLVCMCLALKYFP